MDINKRNETHSNYALYIGNCGYACLTSIYYTFRGRIKIKIKKENQIVGNGNKLSLKRSQADRYKVLYLKRGALHHLICIPSSGCSRFATFSRLGGPTSPPCWVESNPTLPVPRESVEKERENWVKEDNQNWVSGSSFLRCLSARRASSQPHARLIFFFYRNPANLLDVRRGIHQRREETKNNKTKRVRPISFVTGPTICIFEW